MGTFEKILIGAGLSLTIATATIETTAQQYAQFIAGYFNGLNEYIKQAFDSIGVSYEYNEVTSSEIMGGR